MSAKRRVGIFGGTFNPIHIGHLILAQTAVETLHLERVIFVPTGKPPHKLRHANLAPAEDRFQMVRLAIAGNEHFSVSRFEIDSEGPCYTIDTLRGLEKEMGPECEIVLLVGGDWAGQIHQWHRGNEILERYTIAAARRGNMSEENNHNSSSLTIPMPTIEVSSSQIRERLRGGLSVRYLVHQSVADYIEKNGLYRE